MALERLQPFSDMPEALNTSLEEDAKLIGQLRNLLGEFFTARVVNRGDRGWAAGIISSVDG